jgi:hypothetical protein
MVYGKTAHNGPVYASGFRLARPFAPCANFVGDIPVLILPQKRRPYSIRIFVNPGNLLTKYNENRYKNA